MTDWSDFLTRMDWYGLLDLLISAAAALFCITVHELSHGYTAYRLGDPTAKNAGRLTLNPIRHIDPFGLVMMLAAHVGWAKPVPVDMRYFKRPKAGMAVTALAGPASNFLLAMLLLFFASLTARLAAGEGAALLYGFLVNTALLSVGLGLFNLVPIPPLDGSKVLFALLPERAYYTLMRYERYGMAVLLLLVWLDVGGGYLSEAIYRVFMWMAGLFF